MRSATLVALLAIVLAMTACGGDAEELSKKDAQTLTTSREDLDDALDTEETLRTSKEEAASLRLKVQRIIGRGAFENGGKPDEFGLAALGELRELVPSLVLERGDSVVALDARRDQGVRRPGRERSRRRPCTCPPRARWTRSRRSWAATTSGPTPRPGKQTVSEYLRETEGDVRPVWPRLAERLQSTREEL